MKRVHVQYYSIYSHIIEIALSYTKNKNPITSMQTPLDQLFTRGVICAAFFATAAVAVDAAMALRALDRLSDFKYLNSNT